MSFLDRPLPWFLLILICSVIRAVDIPMSDGLLPSSGKIPYEAYRLSPSVTFAVAPPHKISLPEAQEAVYVYMDKNSALNHYVPSGWMGDYSDLQLVETPTEGTVTGAHSLKITYNPKGSEHNDWAGIYWQHPGNNWGGVNGGYNLKPMRRLTFWARGANGGEMISVFKIGGIQGKYPDSDCAQIGPVVLTREWKRYTIDLSGLDLSHIIGGFGWATGRYDNPGPVTFYLGEIRYES